MLLLSQGGLPVSEIGAVFIRNLEGKGPHTLLFSIKKIVKSLKVGVIFMYSFNKYLLSIELSAFRVLEYNVSKADMVPGLSS